MEKVTQADILKGRGVAMKKGGKVNFIQEAIKKTWCLKKVFGRQNR
jgi:hypothetical protein